MPDRTSPASTSIVTPMIGAPHDRIPGRARVRLFGTDHPQTPQLPWHFLSRRREVP